MSENNNNNDRPKPILPELNISSIPTARELRASSPPISPRSQQRETRKILIIYTGGTIGMKKTEHGYAPAKGYLSNLLNEMPECRDPRMPAYDIKEYDPLLDSSSISAQQWTQMAHDIQSEYHNYDSFLILHGTDTMSYTACALSFMLSGLNKIVILTGSQIPISEIRNDGRGNIITSLFLCAQLHYVPEVCIYFKDKLNRGNRTSKVDIWSLNAFESVNYPPLADIDVDVVLHKHLLLAPSTSPLKVRCNFSGHVLCFRITPNFSSQFLERLCQGSDVQGIILESFGAGNFPDRSDLLHILEQQVKNGVVIVIVSQVHKGLVNMDKYEAGAKLKEIGCISAYDMTPECAVVKLQFLLGQGLTPDEVKKQMKCSIVGELSPPSGESRIQSSSNEPLDTDRGSKEIYSMSYMSSLGYFRRENPPEFDECNH